VGEFLEYVGEREGHGMRQATHRGECQICGRTQKLPSASLLHPSGVLSKHGYTVGWGYFSGICRGSGSPPFEVDRSLIDDAIRGAKAHQATLVEHIAELRANKEPARTHVRYYSKRTYSHESAWVDTSTLYEERGVWLVQVTDRTGEHTATLQCGYSRKTRSEAAYAANVRQADYEEGGDLRGITDYIAWQTHRLSSWRIQPLQAIV